MDVKKLFKKDYVIGLDIGAYSVKMAQFISKEDGLHLVKADLKEIGVSRGTERYDNELVSALRHIVRGIDLKKASVIASVNCSHTSVKKVTVPYMPRSELREGIMLQAKTYFPFETDKSILDFEVLGDVVEKGVRKYELLVGVCPLNTVNKYLALLQKADIRPASLVSTPYAMQILAEKLSKKPDQAECYIDIGDLHSELIICRGGFLVFSRKIPVYGNDFTKALTGAVVSDKGRTQLSVEEAEKIKRDIGMPGESDTRIIDNKIPAGHILSMLRSPAENLANEIDRCFAYYREDPSSIKISSITIFGGGASLGGLVKFLARGLGMDVRLGDALEAVKADKAAVKDHQALSHRLNLAIGAALTEAKGMNLLPPEIKDQAQRTIARGTIEAALTAVVIVSILLFVGMKIKINNFNKRISVAKLELASLQSQYKAAQARKIAETVLVDEPYWEDVFKELASLMPDAVVVNNFRMENKTITMKGRVDSPDGQQIITDFVITLERGLFDRVKLVESKNLPDGTGIEFEIKCWVDYE
jgi:type IV pilus assembly protein PilM